MTQLNFPTTPGGAERHRARLAKREAEFMAATGYLPLTLGQQGSAWLAARELHSKTTRYSVPGVEESSYESHDAYARAYTEADIPVQYTEAELEPFDICTECGRAEAEAQLDNEMWNYLAAIWPCATARVLGAVES